MYVSRWRGTISVSRASVSDLGNNFDVEDSLVYAYIESVGIREHNEHSWYKCNCAIDPDQCFDATKQDQTLNIPSLLLP